MKRFKFSTAGLALGLTFAVAAYGQQGQWDPLGGFRGNDKRPVRIDEYSATVHRVAEMVGNPDASRLVHAKGLNLLNLTWEDTGRYKNSSVGPNISDMTIQVQTTTPGRGTSVKCMPVIRYDNFSDKTADLDPEGFTLLVGNEKGKALSRISLREFLLDPSRYLSKPESWKGRNKTLLADRDTKVLVSAQACFLPVPKQGKAKFNPVLFNYQSRAGDPAVLTILATRQGTSATIIDNKRDAFSEGAVWGQRLFFNQKGQRASLTGERISDFKSSQPSTKPTTGDAGLNMVLLIQVPLKQKTVPMRDATPAAPMFGFGGGGAAAESSMKRASDVEAAVIGHGEMEGPFTEIDNLAIERDTRFPVRVTVQFYKATSNGVVSEADVAQVKEEIDGVYAHGSSVGSLVVGGETGRITEYEGTKVQPVGWWNDFWLRYEQNMGIPRWQAIQRLQKLLGKDYQSHPVCRLYLHDLLRKRAAG